MATVYLKEGKTVEVALEDLETYLQENAQQLKPRKFEVRRPPASRSSFRK